MKALVLEDFGSIDNARVLDVPEPEAGPGEVVVRVKAAALNHLDLWTLSGKLNLSPPLPHVLGGDGAGVIESVGADVNLRPGTSVVVNPGLSCGACERCRAGEHSECPNFQMLGEHVAGTLAELVRVPATNVYPFPDHLDFADAAALGVAFTTAYRMLFTKGRMLPGEWVLITGIGGGLALALFQLARPLAGRVFVTSSSKAKLEHALELGADEAIDYTEEDVGKAVRRLTGKRGVDIAVDSAGGSSLDACMRALRPGGRVVVAGATAGGTAEINVRRLFWSQLQVIGSTMGSHSDVAEMLRMVAGARLRPLIDRTFPLSDGVEALRYLETQQQFGKVVVEID